MKEDAEEKNTQSSEQSDVISFDFSKIKGWFSKGGKDSGQSSFKNMKKYCTLALILIPLILTIYLRLSNVNWPITDEWAKSSVNNYYEGQLRGQILQQYPNLPPQNVDPLVQEQFQKILKTNQAQINQQVEGVSTDMKRFFQDEKGYPYLPDIDTYAHLRYVRNIVEKGHYYDELREGQPYDNHMVAPLGLTLGPVFHNYALFTTYSILHFFSPSMSLMYATGFFSVFLAALSIIPAFFIGKRLSNNVGGFFAAMMIAVSPLFMDRGLWGHIDTDVYNVFFPLLVTWLFLEMFEAKKQSVRYILAGVTGLTMGLYAFAWSGWWHIFDFLLFAGGVYFLYKLITHVRAKEKIFEHKQLRSLFFLLLVFFVSVGIFVTLFNNMNTFTYAILGPFDFLTIKEAAKASLWPNVYTTVAELNSVDFRGVLNTAGGSLLFGISLLGIFFTLFKKDEHGHIDIKYPVLIIAWYIAVFYASFQGVRFMLLLLPPFAIAFGNALGVVYSFATKYFEKEFDVHKLISGTIIFVGFCLLLITPLRNSYAIATHDLPIMNDAWYNALDKIKMDSKPDAIINSWWDFGHHFKYVADRSVTFDGASQNTPQAHWIGKALLTSNEEEAIGILRMLDCGGNKAFEVIDSEVKDISVSVKKLYSIFTLSKENARKKLLADGISQKTTDEVLQYTHCAPPEDYFITSDDMVGKSGVWAHFGSWDFDRADIWIETRKLPSSQAVPLIMKNMGISSLEAEQLYNQANSLKNDGDANQWIAPWPSFGGTANCRMVKELWQCENGLIFSLDKLDAISVTTQQETSQPKRFLYFEGNTLKEKVYQNSTLPLEFSFMSNNATGTMVISQGPLGSSMFARLYYFGGKGLSHFELVTEQSGFVGTRVLVWKVKW